MGRTSRGTTGSGSGVGASSRKTRRARRWLVPGVAGEWPAVFGEKGHEGFVVTVKVLIGQGTLERFKASE